MKRLLISVVLLSAGHALACTGFYVGKDVSADGSVLLGRTVDHGSMATSFRTCVTEAVQDVPGRIYKDHKGFAWPLPATTWKYVSTPVVTSEKIGSWDSVAANEKGLTVTATVTGHLAPAVRKALPLAPHGLAERNATGLIAASCATVQEALDLIAEVMAQQGTSEPNIIMLADQKEAWLVETYTTNLWAAMRLPTDKVAGFGNHFVLEAYDPKSPDWRAAPEIESAPKALGFAVYEADGKLNLHRTYDGPRFEYANIRTWFAHRFLAPSTAGDYVPSREMPPLYAPDRKISIADLTAAMRTRYEGTAWCPEETGRDDVRVIGDESQATCHVVALRDDLPADRAVTVWACLAPSEHAVFLPMANCTTEVASDYSMDVTDERRRAFDVAVAGDVFNRLAALCQTDRRLYGRTVRDHWAQREKELLEKWPSVWRRGDAAEMTRFTVAEQTRAVAEARRMSEEILFKMMKNSRTYRWMSINGHPLPVIRLPYEVEEPSEPGNPYVDYELVRADFDADRRLSDVIANTNVAVCCKARYRFDAELFAELWTDALSGNYDTVFAAIADLDPKDEIQRLDMVDLGVFCVNRILAQTEGGRSLRRRLAAAGADMMAYHPSFSANVVIDRKTAQCADTPFDWKAALQAEKGTVLPRYVEFARGWYLPLLDAVISGEPSESAKARCRDAVLTKGLEAYRPQDPKTLRTFRRAVNEARVAAVLILGGQGGN